MLERQLEEQFEGVCMRRQRRALAMSTIAGALPLEQKRERRPGLKNSEMRAESEQKDCERRRWENRAAWHSFRTNLCEVHARISPEHEARAITLLKKLGRGGDR
jgi:hypothetical protein